MELVTYEQLGQMLNVPVGTLQFWVHKHQIPHVRLGKRTVRFDPAEVRDWVARRTHKPAEPAER